MNPFAEWFAASGIGPNLWKRANCEMTAHPAPINALALPGGFVAWSFVCMGAMSMLGGVQERAQAQEPVAPRSAARVPWDPDAKAAGALGFDIPAQELGGALNAYSRVTGLAVMIDSAHARRPVAGVQGVYTSTAALQQLLAGTGLRARSADANSIVISLAPDAPPVTAVRPSTAASNGLEIAGVTGREPGLLAYIAKVQTALRDSLCASPQTRPGAYRLALQVRLDARGGVERFRLLDTTGQPARDAAISAVVKAMTVGEAPPASLVQPVSILLVPDGPSAQTRCPSAASSRDARSASQASRAFEKARG